MKLLLDTHVLLWAATSPERLTANARAAIEDGETDIFVSAVTAWEIAIKQSLGKLELARPAELWFPEVLDRSGFQCLSVDRDAALRVRALPWHHRDPFDRLLVAHALAQGCTIVTRDPVFASYGVAVLAA